MPNVSVIVVNYNTRQYLDECLAAIEPDHEVIVVDNDSRDGSAEMVRDKYPHVILIQNERNRGFGAANNQGFALMTGKLALLLNSDARTEPGSIQILADLFEDETVVAAGGRLMSPDGSLQNSCCNRLTLWAVICEQFYMERVFPNSSLLSPYWITNRLSPDAPTEVFQVMGACLMLRPQEVFDERFFLYCEDTELCFRLRSHGKILYEPRARFVHALGASSSGSRWESIARYNLGKELYFQIHHEWWTAGFCFALDRLGAGLRLATWALRYLIPKGNRPFLKNQIRMFWKVLTAPLDGPRPPADRS